MEGPLEVTPVAQEGKEPAQGHTVNSWSRQNLREFPGGPVVRPQHFHCRDPGSIPGWGTNVPQAWPKKKKKTGLEPMPSNFVSRKLRVILCLPRARIVIPTLEMGQLRP